MTPLIGVRFYTARVSSGCSAILCLRSAVFTFSLLSIRQCLRTHLFPRPFHHSTAPPLLNHEVLSLYWMLKSIPEDTARFLDVIFRNYVLPGLSYMFKAAITLSERLSAGSRRDKAIQLLHGVWASQLSRAWDKIIWLFYGDLDRLLGYSYVYVFIRWA